LITEEDDVARVKKTAGEALSEVFAEFSEALADLDFEAKCAIDELNRVERRLARMKELDPDR